MSAAVATGDIDHRNEVSLVGRLTGEPIERVLPSGDVLMSWRLVVERPPGDRSASRSTVDVVDCATWRAAVRRSVSSWVAGDVVEIEGVLRRRFWRTASGPASRHEVEARSARRLRRAG